MTCLGLYRSCLRIASGLLCLAGLLTASRAWAADPNALRVLMLGDEGHHRPAEMAQILIPAMAKVEIAVEYTKEVQSLTRDRLSKFDVLAIFRDSGDLPAGPEAALFEFIESGKGVVAIHCASHCFRNSDRYTALVGGRFLRHGGEVFRARIIDAQHPAMRGVQTFESWDETYVHNQLASDNRVLMVREDQGRFEPYTWVREQGKGRLFYTALGHDEHTWKQPGFHRLLEQGMRWAAGRLKDDVKPFEYVEANVPNYLAGRAWGTIGEPIRRMQKPLTPAESMKHMHLPEGFEIQLYAAEPDITRPIAMAWDERGRLWIAETVDYPNDMEPPGHGHDRIKICEDTDGDGRADKFTIFADQLSIPTSLTLANGGVVISQAPDMLFLKSSKGDDHADIRKVLFTGWGTSDTHAGPSNLRWGFDNWIWGTVGYSGFEGRVGSRDIRFGQGFWRMKPDGSELEFLSSTSNNTWGLGFSEKGQAFASTANNQHSVQLVLPNRIYEGVRGWHGQGSAGIEDHKRFHPITSDVRQVDWHGGFTAACGHALYTARNFPKEFWDHAAFVCEPTGHLLHIDWLVPRGTGYVARDGYNLLASDDAWTSPIMAEVGPDGALWVIDWYNYIVQHNPTPSGFKTGKGGAYVTPLRDKKHGRIYRITYKGGKLLPRPRLDQATTAELVAALSQDNLWWRLTAQRLLVERGGSDAVTLLAKVVQDKQSGLAAIHALHALEGLSALSSTTGAGHDALHAGLEHPEPAVRQTALALLPRDPHGTAAILEANSLRDADPHVRLQALIALGERPGCEAAAEAILAMFQESANNSDPWIPVAAISAAARSDQAFLIKAAQSSFSPEATAPLTRAVRAVAEHYARRSPEDGPGRLLAALGTGDRSITDALLKGLAAGWPSGHHVTLDAPAMQALTNLPTRLTPAGLLQLASLLKRWGLQDHLQGLTASLRTGLCQRVVDGQLSSEDRVQAARDLVMLGNDEASVTAILQQLTPKAEPALTRGLLEALGESTSVELGKAVIKHWPELTPTARATALNVLLRRPAWTSALLAALEQGQIDKTDLGIDQVQLLSRHPDAAIASRAQKLLARGGGLPNPDRQKVVDSLAHVAQRRGSPALGRQVFEKNCAKCHRHGSLGEAVGPDLTGVGVRDRKDILIDILDPNRSVEGNYRQYTIETKSGTFLTGLLTGETKTAVELLDSEAKKHVILREDIETMLSSKLSLMPEGFEKLTPNELASLLEFLTSRDKYFPLPLHKAATITTVRGMFYDRENTAERLVFPTWGPHTFAGIPFQLLDPRNGSIPNAILLYGPQGPVSRQMPKSVSVPCNGPARTIHLLSGVSGWGFPLGEKGSVSMIVRLHYADGQVEDHPLQNGIHFADYIRPVEVPGSKLAFRLRGQQLRYLTVTPKRTTKIDQIEFVKGPDDTAPIVMAVTIENPEAGQ